MRKSSDEWMDGWMDLGYIEPRDNKSPFSCMGVTTYICLLDLAGGQESHLGFLGIGLLDLED